MINVILHRASVQDSLYVYAVVSDASPDFND